MAKSMHWYGMTLGCDNPDPTEDSEVALWVSAAALLYIERKRTLALGVAGKLPAGVFEVPAATFASGVPPWLWLGTSAFVSV